MKRMTVALYLVLCGVTVAVAQTYQWTDDNGVVNYTDDLNSVPTKYRSKVKKRDDITTRNPKVRQELNEQERRARQDELNSPRIQPSPNMAPPTPTPPRFEQSPPLPGETPAGRSKSERIRENIERRQIE